MSAWRRVAIEKIPRHRQLIEEAESVGMLWVELWPIFARAHSEPADDEIIRQIYDYAWWCANAPDPNTSTMGIVSFYEDLPCNPAVRAQMARWLPAELFAGMGETFRYHLSTYEEYREFVREFYEQRAKLGDAAARSDEAPLPDDRFQARVSEAVTHLQAWKQEHGQLQFEYMARATVLEQREVMARLAPAVRQCHGGAHAMAAAITPILRSLAASGAVPFPADPLVCAAAAMLLSSRGPRPGGPPDGSSKRHRETPRHRE